MKSTVDEIEQRFDADVERFSNLETGQSATVDAPFVKEIIVEAAAIATSHAPHVLDGGCRTGNYTLKLLERRPNLDATLIDLSQPMSTGPENESARRPQAASRRSRLTFEKSNF